ncbi:MAG TPA: MXAN_5187 C-terminal domain-containing protein [Vicinamibacterales bacterium]|nr:MXAN_5187 C-terminal domain-containing protein [Vicinamibacterales bacterium]
MPPSEIDRDITRLEADLKQLEAEYNMFFSGRLPKPPWETRARVDALVKQLDHGHIPNTGDRFRFTTVQSRYATFIDLWDRGLRAREEGRPGPFAQKHPTVDAQKKDPGNRILHVSAFRDPLREIDKLTELYESLAEARREVGGEAPPFHKFAELVKSQVKKLRDTGSPEVAFRVAVKDGKVSFTARALKGVSK